MIEACKKSGMKVALAFQTRYSPRLPVIAELIKSGKLGQVLEYRARGKEDARGGSEDLWVLGPHLMNLIHFLSGEPKSCFGQVFAKGQPIQKADIRPGTEGIPFLAGDEVHATYRMADGTTATFDSVRNAGGGPRFGLWILCTKGIIELGTNYMPPVFVLPHTSWSVPRGKKNWLPLTSAGLDKPEPLTGGPHEGDVEAAKDLVAAVEKGAVPKADITAGRVALEMIAGVFASQRQGKPVALPLKARQDPMQGWPA
jgi:predicted dehydrogenase